jgi:hypothetical protein
MGQLNSETVSIREVQQGSHGKMVRIAAPELEDFALGVALHEAPTHQSGPGGTLIQDSV